VNTLHKGDDDDDDDDDNKTFEDTLLVFVLTEQGKPRNRILCR
jgi:hypothetical protein